MYVLIKYFSDGSGAPKVSFIPTRFSDQRESGERRSEEVMAELLEKISDLRDGDTYQLYLINKSGTFSSPVSGQVNRTKISQ